MLTTDLDYDLPQDRIATHPAAPREDARLMVVRRSADTLEHRRIRDLPDVLDQGDLLVRNDTAVLAARLRGRREAKEGGRGGGRVEGLFVDAAEDGSWRVLLEAGGRLQQGDRIDLGPTLSITLLARRGRSWIVRPSSSGRPEDLLDACGLTPLPPYILKARRRRREVVEDEDDRRWYATCFADGAARSSVAAPTAGLHLTPALDASLSEAGIETLAVTLHVGEGTFRPIEADTLEAHAMHEEHFLVRPQAMERLRKGPSGAGRLVAVGTTTTRLLESLPESLPPGSFSGTTDLCIAPGHRWRRVEGLLTNFHLPRSTLLALVGAFVGMPRLHALYATAVEQRYRFYSYGDAMLILP